MKKQILIGSILVICILTIMSIFNLHMHNDTIKDVICLQAIITWVFICFDCSKQIIRVCDFRDKQEYNMITSIIGLGFTCLVIGLFKDYESVRTILVYLMPVGLLMINRKNKYLVVTLLVLTLLITVW